MTASASYTPGAGEAFGAGVAHPVNNGRANTGSITLGGSLQADSDRWDNMTPHGVLASATAAGLDYAGVQRMAGTYQPGSMGRLADEFSGGTDDYESDEE